LHRELVQRRIAELKSRIPVGGLREAVIRALIYVGLPRAAVDERGFEAVRRIRRAQEDMPALPLSDFKALMREQYFMLLIDPEAAIAALPSLLPENMETRGKALAVIRQVLAARGGLSRRPKRACSISPASLPRMDKRPQVSRLSPRPKAAH
jgi:hypothetical protein